MRTLGAAVALVVGVFGLSGGPARGSAPAQCGTGAPTTTFSGSFASSLQGSYVLVPFEVTEGTTKVRVRLCYDQPEAPTATTPQFQIRDTLDLGLYQPTADGFYDTQEFRGWGGSSRLDSFVSPKGATVGFMPGPIPSGTWAAEIGLAAIPGPEGGDLDASVAWRLEVLLTTDPADAQPAWEPTPYDETPANANAGWYKGDFHVHARNSNPADATMREVFDYAFGPRPAGAGLDFITLSDYVGGRQWDEIGLYQDDYPGRLVVRSAEVITYRGHVNNHGSHTYVDYRTGPVYLYPDVENAIRAAQPASRIFDDIHAASGWTQVNHPTIFPSKVPAFAAICRGCSWEYTDGETQWDEVDAFEVQTGPAGYTDPPNNEPGPNPFTPQAIAWWDDLTRAGHRITAVGSSDSHKAGAQSLTQSPVGEATSVVYAHELSEAGIGQGIRAGHAYVKFFQSDGPDLRLDATSGAGETAMMGDTISGAGVELTARVLNGFPTAASPQPRMLLVVRDGIPILAVPVTSPDFVLGVPAPVPGHYRLQLQRGTAIEALTNPITVREAL